MAIRDALYDLVHDYPGGAPALAPRMKLAASTLLSMANPNCDSHDWPLKRVEQAIAFSGDHRPVDALCAQFGGVFVPLGDLAGASDSRVLKAASKLAKEFGDVPRRLQEALQDGTLAPRECEALRREVYEMNQAAAALMRVAERICAERVSIKEEDRP